MVSKRSFSSPRSSLRIFPLVMGGMVTAWIQHLPLRRWGNLTRGWRPTMRRRRAGTWFAGWTCRLFMMRLSRGKAALTTMTELEAVKYRQRDDKKTNHESPRASTTDADARWMRMGHGGFAPAYNVQIATDQTINECPPHQELNASQAQTSNPPPHHRRPLHHVASFAPSGRILPFDRSCPRVPFDAFGDVAPPVAYRRASVIDRRRARSYRRRL